MAPPKEYAFVACGPRQPIATELLSSAVDLERSANLELYSAITPCEDAQRALSAGVLGRRMTEVENLLLMVEGNRAVGLVAYFGSAQFARRKLLTLLHLFSGISDRNDGAAERAHGLQAAPSPTLGEGVFISRLAVTVEARGSGRAEALLARVQGLYPTLPLLLHVRRSNARALRFYSRVGFVQTGRLGETLLLERDVRRRSTGDLIQSPS